MNLREMVTVHSRDLRPPQVAYKNVEVAARGALECAKRSAPGVTVQSMTEQLREMTEKYHEEGLTMELAAARVCQDVVLKAIEDGPLNRNVTIKGGVVMRSITKNNRRATRDIDLDFIHYSLDDESM